MATPNIKFGTSGWSALIAEDLNYNTIRRVSHAAAEHVREHKEYGYKGEEYLLHLGRSGRQAPRTPHVVIGYDTRYLSDDFARTAAEAAAADGVTAVVSKDESPTPAVALEVLRTGAAGGMMITASHAQAHYGGFKWTPYWGGPAINEITADIEARAQALTNAEVDKHTQFEQGVAAGIIRLEDLRERYSSHVAGLLDFAAIKKAGLKIAADPAHGAGRGYLRPLLEKAGARVTGLREDRDVLFGGRAPDTAEANLAGLKAAVTGGKLNLGLACDGDAERYGIIDSDGTWISPNLVLGLVTDHLVRNRGLKGKVARSVMTSHFVDAVAKSHGLEVRETPVGFKHLGNLLRTGQYLIGGEESAGLSVMGHAPEKDGILACLLVAELAAYERKPLRKILEGMQKRFGQFINTRTYNKLAGSADTGDFVEKLRHNPPLNIAGASVWRIDHTDGFKFIMKDGSWLGLRPSGNEPAVRVYTEARSPKQSEALAEAGRRIVAGKF